MADTVVKKYNSGCVICVVIGFLTQCFPERDHQPTISYLLDRRLRLRTPIVLNRVSSNAVAEKQYDGNHAKTTFADALCSIRSAAEATLDEKTGITAICIPEHFNASLFGSVYNAIRDPSVAIHKPW